MSRLAWTAHSTLPSPQKGTRIETAATFARLHQRPQPRRTRWPQLMATALQEFKGEAKRAEVVKLRLAGHTYEEIGQQVGLSISGVRHHTLAWVDSIAPPDERAHELRETWGSRLERLHQAHWPAALDGDVKATEHVLRIQAQFAKLFGLELQPGITVNVLTAEGMAAALGLDPTMVVDVEAKEITDGSDA